MELRLVSPPKTYRDQNPPNRQGVFTMGPLKFANGKFRGKCVPTRARKVIVILCERCKLPSYPGLPPLVKAFGFDRKSGEAIEQYVHERCPGKVAENMSAIARFRAEARKLFEDAKKLAHPRSRTYNPKRFRQ